MQRLACRGGGCQADSWGGDAAPCLQGLWTGEGRGRGWHCWPAARTLVGSGLQHQHAQLVRGAHQFMKVTKQVLHRDKKQLKYCSI